MNAVLHCVLVLVLGIGPIILVIGWLAWHCSNTSFFQSSYKDRKLVSVCFWWQVENEIFFSEFIYHVKHFLIVFKREPAVERAIEFFAKFGTSLQKPSAQSAGDRASEPADSSSQDDMHPFLLQLFQFLIKVRSYPISRSSYKRNVKSFPSHEAHRAALISVWLALTIFLPDYCCFFVYGNFAAVTFRNIVPCHRIGAFCVLWYVLLV